MPPNHGSDRSLQLAFWNVWLLNPRLWPNGPQIPGVGSKFAPDVTQRATLVGEALRDRFDVCALGEAFEEVDQHAVGVRSAMRVIAGPQRRFPKFTGSGLATLVNEHSATVTASNQHRYRSGGDLRDSDTFATKGALHVRIDATPHRPAIDIVSTHLFAGAGLFSSAGRGEVDRFHRVKLAQLRELVSFVTSVRHPDAALLLVGDFNVAALDPDPSLTDPTVRYNDMVEVLSPLGVADLWAEHGQGLGHTCTFDTAADLPPDPNEPDAVMDDPTISDPTSVTGERIDYLFFAQSPTGPAMTIGRPRRWAFPGRAAQGGPAGSLSDHLAISVELGF